MATFGFQSGVGTSVETGEIADGAVTNAKVNASAAIDQSKLNLSITNSEVSAVAAIAQSKLNLSITNTEVNASAGIVDTKLAQIATAGKVSGAALTSLTSVPSGAGLLPAANTPAPPVGHGVFTRVGNAADSTVTQAHGLGKTPTLVFVSCGANPADGGNGAIGFSFGSYAPGATTTAMIRTNTVGTTLDDGGTDTTNVLYAQFGTGVNGTVVATLTADSTNLSFAFVKSGTTDASTLKIHWWCF